MFDSKFITTAINRSTQNRVDRRLFMRAVGLTGLGAGAAAIGGSSTAFADESAGQISDFAILNFALNLEYLEAEFYARAVTGRGLPDAITGGLGDRGRVVGGSRVNFQTTAIRNYAIEIAADEIDHVNFLRKTLGSQKVAEPAIDLRDSFTAVATAAGLIQPGETFDPFANEQNFLLGAFIFEDVGVTGYKGAAPLITNKTYLEAAAGLLAVEAYHAANIRTSLNALGLQVPTVQISDARDSLDGPSDLDQGLLKSGFTNIVPTDGNGLAFSRTTGQVLNIVYITPEQATSGGFFPDGVNGPINQSDDNS